MLPILYCTVKYTMEALKSGHHKDHHSGACYIQEGVHISGASGRLCMHNKAVMSDYRLRESTGCFLGYLEMHLQMCNGCLCYIELLERPKTSKLHVRYISLFTSKLCKVIWLLWRFQSSQVTQAGDTCSAWPTQ